MDSNVTALHVAAMHNHSYIAYLLLKAGADMTIKTKVK